MVQRIILIGALPDDPSRSDVLTQLDTRSGSVVEWDWVRAEVASGGRPAPKDLRRLLTELQQLKKQGRQDDVVVVKLPVLRPDSIHAIHSYCDPAMVPRNLYLLEEIVEWLFCDDANLIPKREWFGTQREAALVAILSKLIRNKSWNKDTQGHAWTTEENLLGQAPVSRPGSQIITVEARRMLPKLNGGLLITKGGTAGTPKEWCIRLQYVGSVKDAMIKQAVSRLLDEKGLEALANYVNSDSDRSFRLDGEIVNEKIRSICRAQNH